MIKKFNYFFITLIFFGNIEKYKGTWASLLTTFLLFIVFYLLKIEPIIVTIVILFILIYSIFAIKSYTKNFKDEDPQEIVIDEFIGQSIPVCLYEVAHNMSKETDQVLKFYFIMFVLFRIFDITKPFPVNYYDKNFKNGFGIIMDDVCAGLYVVVILVLYMILI